MTPPLVSHTPGPWITRHGRIYGQEDPRSRHPGGRVLIGGVVDDASGWESPFGAKHADIERRTIEAEASANARLIAASPELLDVAERIAEHWADALPREVRDELTAAIRKARGSS